MNWKGVWQWLGQEDQVWFINETHVRGHNGQIIEVWAQKSVLD